MSLREDVALMFGAILGYQERTPDVMGQFPVVLRLADEAIRFAAWNRLEGIVVLDAALKHNQRRLALGLTDDLRDISLTGDLTLPPDDWKP